MYNNLQFVLSLSAFSFYACAKSLAPFTHRRVNNSLVKIVPSLHDSFINSFINIEHLHSASSRELLRGDPDSSTAKKSSLKLRRKNAGDKALEKIRSLEGSLFQIEGPTMENARLCLVEVRANGTRRRPCLDERSDRELIALRRGQQSSQRKRGARQLLLLLLLL